MKQASKRYYVFSRCFGILALCCFWASALFGQPKDIYSLLKSPDHQVLVVAHLANPFAFPENSLEGLRHCINNGIDIAEVDVQRTKDGQLVLMHDLTVSRTTTGRGRVSQLTWRQIQALHLRDRFKNPTPYRVPLLREALVLAKGKIVLNIDKAGFNTQEIMQLVKELDCGPYVIMKGLVDLPGYERLKQKSVNDPLFMPIVTVKTTDIDSFTRLAHPLAMEILVGHDSTYLTSEPALQMFRVNGCQLWFNALFDQIAAGRSERKNKTASWDYFIGLGARFIQTDYPVELMQYLVSKGLRSPPLVVPDFGNATASTDTLPAMPGKSAHVKHEKYVVRKGDTLSMIAHRNKVSVSAIIKLNPELKKDTTLSVGQVVLLPAR